MKKIHLRSKKSFPITKISITKRIKTFDDIDVDDYMTKVDLTFTPNTNKFEYLKPLDEKINSLFEKSNCTIEETLGDIVDVVLEMCPTATDIHVESKVERDDLDEGSIKVEIDYSNKKQLL